MKLLKKTLILLFALIFVLGSNVQVASVLAAELSAPKVTVLQNDFIKITVDNATGRYGIRTVEGQTIRKKDDNVNMLFQGDDPETSFTTFRIDGTDYIFGNPYKFGAAFFSEITPPRIVENSNGTKQIETVWTIKGVAIKQIIMLYSDKSDKKNVGNVNIRYEVLNNSGAQVQLGSRMLLDTMVGGNDGPQFQIGTAYQVPLTVERKLVHDPENDPGISEEDRPLYKLPPYWIMRDKLDLTNPQATNVMAYGFNNFAEKNINIVDEMIVGHWNGLANTKWDYTPNPNLDFTRDTNDYGTADSAVAFYWQPKPLANQAVQTFETVYGLGEIIEPDKVFSTRYLDPPQQLATLSDNSDYVGEGIFDLNAEVENLAVFNMEQSNIEVELTLDSGLNFVKLDEQGNIVRDANGKALTEAYRSKKLMFRKSATPEEAEKGIIPKYKPGDTVTASFKVQAKGKPWPTTKQYMMTVRSPETQVKLEGETDEGIKAQYESSKSNFVLLPAIGNAVPTYAYGLTPKEAYSTDVKYITVNMTNIDAYNTGNETTDPNFDLYLKDKATGKRYKVPVKSSVILQPTDDGFSGDMRITYRGGDLVDGSGKVIEAGLGPELPLGEYQVEIDYKGDTGGDADIAAMYDLTTSQTFAVTDNDANRVREAKIMAVYKQMVDLSHVTPSLSGKLLDDINSAFPGEPFKKGTDLYSAVTVFKNAKYYFGAASKAIDPEFDLSGYLDDQSLKEVPAYNYALFASQDEMDEFFEDEEKEKLVDIRGMIKTAGTGADQQVIVDTKTEPAIINGAVAYKGKDMVFSRGKLDIFGAKQKVNGFDSVPFFDTLFVKGDGTLSVASSGFVFHKGEWTLDFYNGFDKTLGEGYTIPQAEFPKEEGNEEDDSLNGTLRWATGALGDRLNPLRQLMIQLVYFNKHSLFAVPNFTFSGFGISFNDFILRPGGVSFGGTISLKVLNAEVRNVVFNDKGFVGIDAGLKFDLNESLGLIEPDKKESKDAKKEPEGPKKPSGEINIVHYTQKVDGVSNTYGLKFNAQLKSMTEIGAEISFKQVDDGRILPDVIAFSASLDSPGVLITGATYLTGVRGAVRELADTIAGGTKDDPFPLVIEAGVSLRFGVAPAYFFGDIDLTLKRTGIKLEGKMNYSPKAAPKEDDLIKMLTQALIEAQWVTPWFVRMQAEVDIAGWNVIVGKAGVFVGQNLEKHRTDFEGYIGAKVQIPSEVPVVGGMPLSSMFFGLNNDKVWGSVGILFISLGITYYWGGGVEFGTSSEQLPDGFTHLLINDPNRGPRMLVIGQGVKTVATSWVEAEKETHEIVYRDVAEGVQLLDNGSMDIGIGGITVKNGGRVHEIPMDGVTGNAIIEVEYTDQNTPSLTLKDAAGQPYPIIYDDKNTNPDATAFTQIIPAAKASDKVDHRKAYIVLPQDRVQKGGTWTLTSESAVQTKLLNVPTLPQLKDVSLTKDSGNANRFTANWSVENAKPEDTVNLYLTKEPVSTATTQGENGQETLDPGDPGILIARDVKVSEGGGLSGTTTSGHKAIDVTQVDMLDGTEDIRGLMQQGNYYLRAELKSESTFGTKTSAEQFEIIDPLAPQPVSDISIEPAGNGYFALSFKPAAKKDALKDAEHSYVINAMQEQNGKLLPYDNFGELMFTEQELASHWNAETGKYEGILLGGWTATTTSDAVDQKSLNGGSVDPSQVKYVGLQVGQEYKIGVSAVVKPSKELDKNENFHYADRTDSVSKLLPVPAKPDLETSRELLSKRQPKIDVLTNNVAQQSVELYSDQQDVSVEAFYNGQSLGKTALQNEGSGSHGVLQLAPQTTDGTYAIELVATNTKTKDSKVKMLYLTVDTIAPILYLDEPVTGARTSGGKIRVSGRSSNDAGLKVIVNGKETALKVGEDGRFSGEVAVDSNDPNAELTVQARDGAGNENKAVVDITNDKYDVPAGLVIKQVPTMKPGDSLKLEARLRISDGKDAKGKPKFKEVEVPQNKISYSILSGDAVELGSDGTITAQATGASLVQASYQVSDGVSLEAMAAAAVQVPAETELGNLQASTSAIKSNSSLTKVTVANPGEMLGYQLVYKVFTPTLTPVVVPVLGQDISGWSFLPEGGVVSAKSGDIVVVAKRTSKDKLAVAASGRLTANVWSSSSSSGGGGGGGGGGGVIPADTAQITVGQRTISAEKNDNVLEAVIAAGDVDLDGSGDIVIRTEDSTVRGYTFRLDRSIAEAAVAKQKNIVIDTPLAKLTLTPKQLAGLKDNLEVSLFPNESYELPALKDIADSLDSALLADGQGVSIKTNIPASAWDSYAAVRVPLPQTADPASLTAVVLKSPEDAWTPLPWKPEYSEDGAYVLVQLTGNGNLVFVRNAKSFSDVDDGYWGKDSISQAAAKLFVLGKGEDTFDPESYITRAEYPTILLRVAGLMNKNGQSSFTDVGAEDWFNRSVSVAAQMGIVNGLADGTYAPQATMSRIEAMTMAGRLLQALGRVGDISEEEADQALAGFTDADEVPDWAKIPAALCIKNGIIEGDGNHVNPLDELTRAQAAAIAIRLSSWIASN
ncbi:Endo-1,4-beta-xylanase A precursor [Paenibacillus konkukensis]|uniref:Endo-1,4-beta-xylanase A n=1 Tax=Paenibacillus konkukensis TaxID=2020716 RepID=A0ABY4RM41_9BACL|nr:S-layer homology domain-containing protein [Paenibacillus konkukensis]UQZ83223.1 Endo-1,4-beta-xylanase A precursor [Paenibacillus konkukensis]